MKTKDIDKVVKHLSRLGEISFNITLVLDEQAQRLKYKAAAAIDLGRGEIVIGHGAPQVEREDAVAAALSTLDSRLKQWFLDGGKLSEKYLTTLDNAGKALFDSGEDQ